VERLEDRLLMANDVFQVPGNSQQSYRVSFDFLTHNTNQNGEFGYYQVDASGKAAGVAPTAAKYPTAAFSNKQIVFTAGQAIGAHQEFEVPGGTRLAFYQIRSGASSNLLLKNPINLVNKQPNGYFSIDAANRDGFDHVTRQELGANHWKLSWEDGIRGGDRDFDDSVIEITASPVASTNLFPQLVQGVFTVPGGGASTLALSQLVSKNANYKSEVGIFPVLSGDGKVRTTVSMRGGPPQVVDLLPGQANYAKVALSQAGRIPLVTTGQTGNSFRNLQLPAGSQWGLYIIQNSTASKFLLTNPKNNLAGRPLAFFSTTAANPDRFDHFRILSSGWIGPADVTNGGDRDFDDLIINFQFPQANSEPPVVTAALARDTGPGTTTNIDLVTFDPSIAGHVATT